MDAKQKNEKVVLRKEKVGGKKPVGNQTGEGNVDGKKPTKKSPENGQSYDDPGPEGDEPFSAPLDTTDSNYESEASVGQEGSSKVLITLQAVHRTTRDVILPTTYVMTETDILTRFLDSHNVVVPLTHPKVTQPSSNNVAIDAPNPTTEKSKWTNKSWVPVNINGEDKGTTDEPGTAMQNQQGIDNQQGSSGKLSQNPVSPPKKFKLLPRVSKILNIPSICDDVARTRSGISNPVPSTSRASTNGFVEVGPLGNMNPPHRGPSATILPIMSTQIYNPTARAIAKIEGNSAVGISAWELSINEEPVIEEDLVKLGTGFGVIEIKEQVFAIWTEESKYYSGVVHERGCNGTWRIQFDDGITKVISQSHIIPIRVLGVGLKGEYCPDQEIRFSAAEIIGQKFGTAKDGVQFVKYAIRIQGKIEPIWCTRRHLTLKMSEVKKLIKVHGKQFQSVGKAGDVSTDNICDFSRRRRTAVATTAVSVNETTRKYKVFRSKSKRDQRRNEVSRLVQKTCEAIPRLPGKSSQTAEKYPNQNRAAAVYKKGKNQANSVGDLKKEKNDNTKIMDQGLKETHEKEDDSFTFRPSSPHSDESLYDEVPPKIDDISYQEVNHDNAAIIAGMDPKHNDNLDTHSLDVEFDYNSRDSSSDDAIFSDEGENFSNTEKRDSQRFEKPCFSGGLVAHTDKFCPWGDKTTHSSDGKVASRPKIANKKKERKIFQGYQFFLTSSDENTDSGIPVETLKKHHAGYYDKYITVNEIERYGGKVFEKIGEELVGKPTFIISNYFARTEKYIYGLAAGFPLVNQHWIFNSLNEMQVLDWGDFVLPAGWSLERTRIIRTHYKKPLKGWHILITPESNVECWRPILEAGGAGILTKSDNNMLIPEETDLVVAGKMCNYTELAKAANLRCLCVVKHEWLVQTIVTGRLARFDIPKYCILNQVGKDEDDDDDDNANNMGKDDPPEEELSDTSSEDSLLSVND